MTPSMVDRSGDQKKDIMDDVIMWIICDNSRECYSATQQQHR